MLNVEVSTRVDISIKKVAKSGKGRYILLSEQVKSYLSHSKPHHSDVMRYCVSFYLQDVKGRVRELERVTERFISISEPLGGIDYSKKLGVDISPRNTFEDKAIARLESHQLYIDVLTQVSDDIAHAKSLIQQVRHGSILWLHYVEGMRWQTIASLQGVSPRTIRRWRETSTRALYYSMPEEYRRYSIPDALPQGQQSYSNVP